jgi:hypothetical protein
VESSVVSSLRIGLRAGAAFALPTFVLAVSFGVLAECFHTVAVERACPLVDAGALVSSSDADGVHLERDAHRRLGEAVAAVVRSAF